LTFILDCFFYITKLQTPPLTPLLKWEGSGYRWKASLRHSPPFKGMGQGWGLYLLLFMIAFAMTKMFLQRYGNSIETPRKKNISSEAAA